MATLGDFLHGFRQFLTLERTTKAAIQHFPNPVTRDPPPGGRFSRLNSWRDERKARLALTTSWSYTAIHRVAMASLAANLMVKRRADEEAEDIKNHPIELLMQNPNTDLDRQYVWLHTIYSMYLHASYWFLYPDKNGDIAEIWPVPFQRMRPVPDESQNPESLFSGFAYRFQTGKETLIPADNVIFLRFPDPFDHYGVWPPMYAFMQPVAQDNAQGDWNTKLFDENSGLPTSIISVPAELSPQQYAEVKKELKKHHGENMVVRAGTISVDFMQQAQKDMEFLDGRKFNREEIYEVIGVPLNISDKEGWRWFINNTVWPVLQMIAGQITTQLTIPFYGPDIFAEFEDIRPQDRSLEVQEATQYWPSFTINETRHQRGMKPLDPLVIETDIEALNGRDLYDDLPIRVLEQVISTLIKPQPEPIPPQLQGFAGIPSMADSAGADHAQELEQRQAADVQDVQKEAQPEAPQAPPKAFIPSALDKLQEIAIKRLERGKSAGYVYFDDQVNNPYEMATILGLCRTEAEIKAVFDHLDDYANIKAIINQREDTNPAQMALEGDFQGDMQTWLAEQSRRIAQAAEPNGELPDAAFWRNETKLLAAFLTAYVERWGDSGISEIVVALGEFGLGLDALTNARAAEWAGKHALELAKGLNDTTRELAKAKIKNWLQTGKPLGVLEKSLAEVISPAWRASLIAQTEVTRAWAEVALQVANEIEVIKFIIWNTANDERVCPICGPLNGIKVMLGQLFDGVFRIPPAHPRCRCGVSFATE